MPGTIVTASRTPIAQGTQPIVEDTSHDVVTRLQSGLANETAMAVKRVAVSLSVCTTFFGH